MLFSNQTWSSFINTGVSRIRFSEYVRFRNAECDKFKIFEERYLEGQLGIKSFRYKFREFEIELALFLTLFVSFGTSKIILKGLAPKGRLEYLRSKLKLRLDRSTKIVEKETPLG